MRLNSLCCIFEAICATPAVNLYVLCNTCRQLICVVQHLPSTYMCTATARQSPLTRLHASSPPGCAAPTAISYLQVTLARAIRPVSAAGGIAITLHTCNKQQRRAMCDGKTFLIPVVVLASMVVTSYIYVATTRATACESCELQLSSSHSHTSNQQEPKQPISQEFLTRFNF
jgi:hypothetical protein